MAQPGYKKEERTGILSNIRYYNKKARDAGNKFVIDSPIDELFILLLFI